MTAKNFCLQVYPKAIIEMHKTNAGKRYYLIRVNRTANMYIASGITPSKTWSSLKSKIEERKNHE